MHLKTIELVNFKVLEDFKAEFSGNVYMISGENEKGKSTLLQAVGILLTGEKQDVLTTGKDKGFAKAVVGNDEHEYMVELKYTAKNPKGILTITDTKTGMKSDRLSTLNDIFKYQDFDAVEFSSWSKTAEGRRKQVEVVKSLLPTTTQERIIAIDNDVKEIKETRTIDNRELKIYDGQIDGKKAELTDEDVKVFANPIDVKQLNERKNQLVALEVQFKGVKTRYDERQADYDAMPEKEKFLNDGFEKNETELEAEEREVRVEFERRIKAIQNRRKENAEIAEAKLAELKAKKDEIVIKQKSAKEYINEAENELKEVESIDEKIEKADSHNRKHQKIVELKEVSKKRVEISAKVELHETQLSKLATEREKLISSSKLPINGLNFSEDGLLLNGIPFMPGSVSSSQEMEISARLVIAKNPNVKIFRISGGESLGGEKLKALVKFAKDNGFQGFIENVIRGQEDLRVEEYYEK
ncbi:MAG: AAA family ATPase [Bacteroidetes bacterium]|nr:AAA family ATPase [Bacteroidota bacterium]